MAPILLPGYGCGVVRGGLNAHLGTLSHRKRCSVRVLKRRLLEWPALTAASETSPMFPDMRKLHGGQHLLPFTPNWPWLNTAMWIPALGCGCCGLWQEVRLSTGTTEVESGWVQVHPVWRSETLSLASARRSGAAMFAKANLTEAGSC